MKKKLNLGSGEDYREGWINLDISDRDTYGQKIKVDIKHDLDKFPYPFKNNQFDEILASHVIEHLKNPTRFMNELIRISKNNAIIHILAPHFSSFTAYSDLTHKRPGISYFTFGVNWTNKEINKRLKVIERRFDFTRTNFSFLNKIFNPIINLSPKLYERFFCWGFPCSQVYFKLRVKKS